MTNTWVVVALLSSASAATAVAQPNPNTVFLENLTWVEVRDAIKAGKTTAIIPTGGTEQNGPHMVLGKHNILVKYKAGEIAKALGNAIVAPVLAYVPEGEIPGPKPAAGHMRFAGTITIPEQVYEGILEYAARSLRTHGFIDIAFIGDSGGNQAGQKVVSEKLNKEWAGTNVRVHHITDFYPGRGDAIAMANGLTMEEVGGQGVRTTSFLYLDPSQLRVDKFFVGRRTMGRVIPAIRAKRPLHQQTDPRSADRGRYEADSN
jgi:creatinine amidohydrolase/Fe(II)-dependent formamide hydrolase-like protein